MSDVVAATGCAGVDVATGGVVVGAGGDTGGGAGGDTGVVGGWGCGAVVVATGGGGTACASNVTVVACIAVPPRPEHVSSYVPGAETVTVILPLRARAPLHAPDATHESA